MINCIGHKSKLYWKQFLFVCLIPPNLSVLEGAVTFASEGGETRLATDSERGTTKRT